MARLSSLSLPAASGPRRLVLRPRDLAVKHVRFALPLTPADKLVHGLISGEAGVGAAAGGASMPALDVSLYIQRKKGIQGPVFQDPTLWSLYVKLVDWKMPTGGTFETLLATYSGVDNEAPDAPQWASQICCTWRHPQQFVGALGWLVDLTRDVLGNPVGREARGLGPWWRIWQYLGGVMESEENGSARAMEDLAYAALVEEIDALHLWDSPTDVRDLEREMRVMHL